MYLKICTAKILHSIVCDSTVGIKITMTIKLLVYHTQKTSYVIMYVFTVNL
jgi:hypothetical protein